MLVLALCLLFAVALAQPRMPPMPGMPGGDRDSGDSTDFNIQQMPFPPGPTASGSSPYGAYTSPLGQFGVFPGMARPGSAPAVQQNQMGQQANFANMPQLPQMGAAGAPPQFGGFNTAARPPVTGAAAAGGNNDVNARPAQNVWGVAPSVFSPEQIQGLQAAYSQRQGVNPLMANGLNGQMMQPGQGGFNAMQAMAPGMMPQYQQPMMGAQPNAFQQQQQFQQAPMAMQQPMGAGGFNTMQMDYQTMQAMQFQQPTQMFSAPIAMNPAMQQQTQLGTSVPLTASSASVSAVNTGFNNLLQGLGAGMTNAGRDMSRGPPPPFASTGNLFASIPGVGRVDLGVPKVDARSPTLDSASSASLAATASPITATPVAQAPTAGRADPITLPTQTELAAPIVQQGIGN